MTLESQDLPPRLAVQPLDTSGSKAAQEHADRRLAVMVRRLYFKGEQYETENEFALRKLRDEVPEDILFRLPEHRRLHAYSEHVKMGINFLADQVTGQMTIDPAAGDKVSNWIEAMFQRSGLEFRKQELPRETMICGDLFCHVVRAATDDLDEPQAMWHLWEAETVEADYEDEDWQTLREVRTERMVSRVKPDETIEEVRIVEKWSMEIEPGSSDGDQVRFGCVKTTEHNGEEVAREFIGLPFIPWVHLHGENIALRSRHGESLITTQVMNAVDRYNATAQLEFTSVRYNSFGTVVVVGDQMFLRDNQDSAYTVKKDVADALVMPGGTEVHALKLDIDVAAFSQQAGRVESSIYGLLGLEEIGAEQLRSFGGVSGYALEILNRKTDGTFRRIVENLREGIQDMIEMGLLVDAYARAEVVVAVGEDGQVETTRMWWTIDPDKIWPDRTVDVNFGTAYIVDEVAVRDDFVANLISRRQALKERGYSDEDIKRIEAEIEAQGESEAGLVETAIGQGRMSTERP